MLYAMMRLSIATAALLVGSTEGFSSFPFGATRVAKASLALFAIRCEEKYYQLEEMEDKDTCTTELFLRGDRSVEFGDTDGPRWKSAVGTWQVAPGTNDFVMEITRTFDAGQSNSDMGEFLYEVKRVFAGEMTKVGESVAITGKALSDSEQDVGFFNMIDATDERVGDDKKV